VIPVHVPQKPEQMATGGVVQACGPKHLLTRITELVQTFFKKVASGILALKFLPEASTAQLHTKERQEYASHNGSKKGYY